MLLAANVALAPAPAEAQQSQTDEAITATLSALLQADGKRARELLAGIPADGLDPKDVKFRECVLARLDGPTLAQALVSPTTGQPDAFAGEVLGLYREYWRRSVMAPDQREAELEKLRGQLGRLLGSDTLDLEMLLEQTKARLEASGFHLINGQTGRLQDLIVWSKEDAKIESVTLPEGTVQTHVFYLNDFQSQGWSSYLSCERTGTGGWATRDGLYVIVPSYESLTDENFTVSFLGHESQHFGDYERFPDLLGWQLEYRAKLAELALANANRDRLLAKFAGNQGDDPEDAHSYANRRVLLTLREHLGLGPQADLSTVPVDQFKQAAVAALRDDSAQRSGKPGK
ncbi:hypothetical protein [Altererythrobacter sp. Root672]|uniref:hypothetical protein n=1 Tax=Altererythrobacter sp. Root672 TaxID=1736584 RepID=UPI0012E3D283|nr:hypothetical protein [Altererythrobacter sp. Root672]